MYTFVLIAQAILLILEYYFYVNDKEAFQLSDKYFPAMDKHSQMMSVALLAELCVFMLLCPNQMYSALECYFIVASAFLTLVHGGLHLVYLVQIVRPNESRKVV